MAKQKQSTSTPPPKPAGWDRIGGEYRMGGRAVSREEYLRAFGGDPYRQTDPYTRWVLDDAKRRAQATPDQDPEED